jgi:hypothetical protein
MDKPTVWVVHDRGGYDFSDASQYGEVKTLFRGEFNTFDLHGSWSYVQKRFSQESSKDDWLIIVGSNIACAIAAIAYAQQWGHLPVLVYHAKRREYVQRELAGLKKGNLHV